MSTPTYKYFSLTGDPLIDGMTHGYYWQLNSDKSVDFSVSNGFNGEYWENINNINYYLDYALEIFSYYANIKFNNLGNYTNPSQAYAAGSEINLAVSGSSRFFSSNSVWAFGFFNPYYNTSYSGQTGDILLNQNSEANDLPSYEPGSSGWALLLHELGHVLGLKHPHDGGGTGRPTFTQLGTQDWDIDWITIMSYDDSYSWNNLLYDPATPMILDVLALQFLYGKNLSTNSGDSMFNLELSNKYITIWDASGNDTVSVKNLSIDWTIILPEIQFSSLVDTKTGIAVPTVELNYSHPKTLYWLAGDFENIEGGSGNDTLIGNSTDNHLDGGSGNDTAIYTGNHSLYKFKATSNGGFTIASTAEGTDILSSIEKIQFNDFTVDLFGKEQVPVANATTNPDTKTVSLQVKEGDGVWFMVHLPVLATQTCTVDFTTKDGTALAGKDYIATHGTLTLSVGNGWAKIWVQTLADNVTEGNETFSMLLTNPIGATFPNDQTELIAQRTIIDDVTLVGTTNFVESLFV